MIARLRGLFAGMDADAIVVDVGGVGYRVMVTRIGREALPAEGEAITLQIHTHVREDAIQLYGFMGEDERAVFEALIGMTGMGPKAAMGVLSGIDAGELARAVVQDDLARLCLIPGVGKKKAERMVMDLKDKLLPLSLSIEGGTEAKPDFADLRSALANLGFKPTEVEQALGLLRKQSPIDSELDALLPQALRILRG